MRKASMEEQLIVKNQEAGEAEPRHPTLQPIVPALQGATPYKAFAPNVPLLQGSPSHQAFADKLKSLYSLKPFPVRVPCVPNQPPSSMNSTSFTTYLIAVKTSKHWLER